jgi:hypothetical protein
MKIEFLEDKIQFLGEKKKQGMEREIFPISGDMCEAIGQIL